MAAERPAYDQALKHLLGQAHDGVLALVAPELRFREALSPELSAGMRQADFVWKVGRPNGEAGLLHLELQTQPDANMGEQMADYAIRLWRREHLPVRSVLILLRRTRRVPPGSFGLDWDERAIMRFAFDVVKLWQLPRSIVLDRPEPALWPLATVMARATAETTALVADRLVQANLPAGERRELVGLLAALAGLRLPRERLLEVLRRDPMIREILRDSSVAQGWWEEGREEGRREGREAGERAGREAGERIGREQGQRELTRLALEGRFGALDADEQAALAAADAATLRAIVAHLTTDGRQEVRVRLGLG